MDNENKNQEFPEQGNFSASPNNNFRQNQLNQKLNNQRANLVEQKIIKEGAKTAANTVAGPIGGAAVDAISKTELGKKAMDGISKVAKNPLKKKFLSSFFDKKEGKIEGETDLTDSIMKYGTIATGIFGVLLILLIIFVIVAIFLSPLIYINDMMENLNSNFGTFGEQLGNFLTFQGWCTDEECEEEQKNDFYKEIENVYEKYENNYSVNLNVNLITATLTYVDPFTTEDDDITSDENGEYDYSSLPSSGFSDFKKSKPKVKVLAKYMVNEDCKIGNCRLDLDRYKQYLLDEFIRKFYYNDIHTSEIDMRVKQTVEDIFSRVELFERMNESNKSDILILNNAMVTILDCNNGMVIEEVSLYKYLQGVLYLEGYATNRSEEFLKAMAIAAKNYLYVVNGATPDSVPMTLRIRSCQMNQIYCSVDEGCHNMGDGENENWNTIATGPNEFGEYHLAPLTNIETLEKIKSAIDSTFNEFIVKDNKFVTTQYRSQCTIGVCDSTTNIMDQLKAYQMVKEGKNYREVLNYFYDGEIQIINMNVVGYPLDFEHNEITSAYGWREHPTKECCAHHNGTDIAAPEDANIYSIADGVIVTNEFSSSYGNYVVVGHGQFNEETNNYEYYSLYAHQVRLSDVQVGDEVEGGQKIGSVGSTGTSTGPHLHIEIYTVENGAKNRIDAVEYFKNVELEGSVGGAIYDSEEDCMKSGKGLCS